MSTVGSSPITLSETRSIEDYTLVSGPRDLPVSFPDTLDEREEDIETTQSTAQKEATVTLGIEVSIDNTNTVATDIQELVSVSRFPTPEIELPAVELGRPTSHELAIERDQQHSQDTEKPLVFTALPESTFPFQRELTQEHEEREELQLGTIVPPVPTFKDIQGYPTTSVQSVEATPKALQTTTPRLSPEEPDKLITNLVLSTVDQISDEYVEPESTAPMQPSSPEQQKKKSKRVRRKEAKMRRLSQDVPGPSTGMAGAPSIVEEKSGVSTATEESVVQQGSILVPIAASCVDETVTSLVHEESSAEVELVKGIEHAQTNNGKNRAE